MQTVPLNATPSQQITVTLNNQPCQIVVRQTTRGLFMDLSVNNVLLLGGLICQNLNLLVRSVYIGFIGDMCFVDTQGANDPDYTGLGSRYQLVYLLPSEIPAGLN